MADKFMCELFNHGAKYPWLNAEANSLMIFMPELETNWRRLSELGVLTNLILTGEIYKKLKETTEPIDIEYYKDKNKEFESLAVEILGDIRETTRNTIKNLK